MEATKEENDWMLPKKLGKEKQPKELGYLVWRRTS